MSRLEASRDEMRDLRDAVSDSFDVEDDLSVEISDSRVERAVSDSVRMEMFM